MAPSLAQLDIESAMDLDQDALELAQGEGEGEGFKDKVSEFIDTKVVNPFKATVKKVDEKLNVTSVEKIDS